MATAAWAIGKYHHARRRQAARCCDINPPPVGDGRQHSVEGLMARPLQGVLPIVHTPFRDDDSLDIASLRREIDWAYGQGADGMGTGMVSELLRLSGDERVALTEQI